jgi:hypothetical protein
MEIRLFDTALLFHEILDRIVHNDLPMHQEIHRVGNMLDKLRLMSG